MGFQLKSPTPGVFQSQFPTPMGDGGGDPMGPRGVWGWGKTLLNSLFITFQYILVHMVVWVEMIVAQMNSNVTLVKVTATKTLIVKVIWFVETKIALQIH